MSNKKVLIGAWTLAFLFALLYTMDALAIPAFARRYKISCSTCHAPIPKLQPYGDEFAGNGFIITEDEKERDYITAGDPLLWLNRTFPVAARFDAYALMDETEPAKKDLQTPWGLKLLSGGTLFKGIGYYFYFYMSERGEVAGIEDAYIHFDNVFNTPLDIMVGQFQTSDPLMKRELRLTFEDYMLYKIKPGDSNTNLTYDRGIMLAYGLEKTGTDLVAMLVNGNGKDPADEETKKFDNDNNKNIGLRLSQNIADYLTVGGFYYHGKEQTLSGENKIQYIGPDINLGFGPVEVTAQYLERKDSNPFYFLRPVEVITKGTIVELILAPQQDRSRFYLTGLYNKIVTCYKLDNDECNTQDTYHTLTVSGTYLLARNLRLMTEFTRDLEGKENRFLVGLVSAY